MSSLTPSLKSSRKEGGRGETGDWVRYINTAMCKRESQWEAAAQHREPSPCLREDLEGWDGAGWEGGSRMGGTCILIADSPHCTAKLTQHCKAIIKQKEQQRGSSFLVKKKIRLLVSTINLTYTHMSNYFQPKKNFVQGLKCKSLLFSC